MSAPLSSSLSKTALLALPIALAACSTTASVPRSTASATEAQPRSESQPPSVSQPRSESQPSSTGAVAGGAAATTGTTTAATTSSATTASASTSASQGGSDDGLLDTLLGNGALTQEQYDRLSAQEPLQQSDAPTVSMGSGGFRVKSADGESSIKVGGRVQVDINQHAGSDVPDNQITDGSELRRARIEMKGTLPNHLLWAAEADFANNVTRVKDFWVGRKKDDGPAVYFGNQKQPFSLEVEMSSNDIPFIERGVDAFLLVPFVDRAIGIRMQDHTDNFFYAAGVYGQSVSPVPLDISLDDEGWGATARVVAAPVQEENKVLHLGLRGSYREPQTALGQRVRDETTNMSNFRVVDTGFIQDVHSVYLFGPEFVYAHGPFSVGGEYTMSHFGRAGEDYDFSGWHAQITYSLTGESLAKAYRLDAGEFKRLKAESGTAWEIAARMANLNLNDGSISGGEEDVTTLGLNWYYSENLRLLLDWSHILSTSGGSLSTQQAEGLNIFAFRAQLNF